MIVYAVYVTPKKGSMSWKPGYVPRDGWKPVALPALPKLYATERNARAAQRFWKEPMFETEIHEFDLHLCTIPVRTGILREAPEIGPSWGPDGPIYD